MGGRVGVGVGAWGLLKNKQTLETSCLLTDNSLVPKLTRGLWKSAGCHSSSGKPIIRLLQSPVHSEYEASIYPKLKKKKTASSSKLVLTCVELDIKICTAALANDSAPSKRTRDPIILAAATKLVSRLLFHRCWGVGIR